jgi:hypothetical protein
LIVARIITAGFITVCIIIILFFFRGMKGISSEAVELQTVAQRPFETYSKDLFVVLLLVLIVSLLPYWTGGLLWPFILEYLILTLFEVVSLHPNQHLKKFVTRYYAPLIRLVVFMAWFGFWNDARNLLLPIWNIAQPSLSKELADQYSLLRSLWDIAPIFMAAIAALFRSRHLRKLAKDKAIPKILESMDTMSNSPKTT